MIIMCEGVTGNAIRISRRINVLHHIRFFFVVRSHELFVIKVLTYKWHSTEKIKHNVLRKQRFICVTPSVITCRPCMANASSHLEDGRIDQNVLHDSYNDSTRCLFVT